MKYGGVRKHIGEINCTFELGKGLKPIVEVKVEEGVID